MNQSAYLPYRSADAGETWIPIFAGSLGLAYPTVRSQESAPSSKPGPLAVVDGQTAFFIGQTPVIQDRAPTLMRTVDGGQSWETRNVTILANHVALRMTFVDADHGWVLSHNQGLEIMATTDGGNSWRRPYP